MRAVKRLDFFERYLSLWVLVCMVVGITFGKLLPDLTQTISHAEFGTDSHVNIAMAVLIWLMIYPMMLKIDFGGIKGVFAKPRGLLVTLFVNWIVKPLSMTFLGWLFIQWLFSRVLGWIEPATAANYVAGLIILAAAPCTAMVFVWSYLTDGDSTYTLAQVAINDLIMVFAFAPIVMVLAGVSGVHIPAQVLITSVVVFIVVPLAAGWISRIALIKAKGLPWFEQTLLPGFRPVAILSLLAILTLIFAFQAENILANWLAVILLAIPITLQVYFNSGLTYGLMRLFGVRHNVATPGTLIGASNFFELAVAVVITLFGPTSPAALATVVGVLVEVPVMLSVCRLCVQSRDWYPKKPRPLMKPTVLILCTGNSCRSHMAEGILRQAAGDILNVQSAGSKPAGYVHPKAIQVMEEIGIDLSAHHSKHMDEFLGQKVDTVITVCGNADQACPIFPGQVHRYHWGFDDPAHATGTEEEILREFRRVRDQLALVFGAYAAGLKCRTAFQQA